MRLNHNKVAIYALTKGGLKQAKVLARSLPYSQVFAAPKAVEHDAVTVMEPPIAKQVAQQWLDFEAHVFVCASGIAVRTIAPLLDDKRSDPTVLCLDEAGRHVIPLVSGHRGGGNALAKRLARIVRGEAVLTTASDVQQTLSVDLMGAPFGWYLAPCCEHAVTTVSAAVVNDLPVLIYQDSGDLTWWPYDKAMPKHLCYSQDLAALSGREWAGVIIVSDSIEPYRKAVELGLQDKTVFWVPNSIHIGIGCDRNTPHTVIGAALHEVLKQYNIHSAAIKNVSSIELKANEQGIVSNARELGVEFICYSAEQLDTQPGILHPSEYVKKVTGSCSVAEAAALRSSDTTQLVVAKQKFCKDGKNVTLAIGRREFSESLRSEKFKNKLIKQKDGEVAPVPDKLNAYGNPVVEGFACKPRHPDLNRPMLHHRFHIMLCEGGRCAKKGSKAMTHALRDILKHVGLNSGEQRIKVSRTQCVGACRQKATLVIYERANAEQIGPNHALWLRNIEEFSHQQWCDLFLSLAQGIDLRQQLSSHFLAPVISHQEFKTALADPDSPLLMHDISPQGGQHD
ncbi:cobalamin biosynthesis protein [Vibrio sp. LaRot3]|uniref:cobalamin biosynthesis protein n=1 Tax=Vibrio sp. LaRot3 TaxID=2998829 RepID=UPI0022CDF59F|nr:cobalamin biosynthesis protein [Vibrio sp. LaRot3]MDA0149605.1 cobalamin biosynthesis protein [Vibrio sp. LaRot3]